MKGKVWIVAIQLIGDKRGIAEQYSFASRGTATRLAEKFLKEKCYKVAIGNAIMGFADTKVIVGPEIGDEQES